MDGNTTKATHETHSAQLKSTDVHRLDYARLDLRRARRPHSWRYWIIAAHFIILFLICTIKLLWFSDLRHWTALVARTGSLPWWNSMCFYWHDNDISIYLVVLIDAIAILVFMVRKGHREGFNHRLMAFSYAAAQVAIAAVGFFSYRVLAWGSPIAYVNQVGTVVSEKMYTWSYTNPTIMAGAIAGPAVVIVAAEWGRTIQNRRQRPVA